MADQSHQAIRASYDWIRPTMYAAVKATLSSPPLPEIVEGKYEPAITKHIKFALKCL